MNEDHLPSLSEKEKEAIQKEAFERFPVAKAFYPTSEADGNEYIRMYWAEGASLQLRKAKKREAGWVSVKERLPDNGVEVLIHCVNMLPPITRIAYYQDGHKSWYKWEFGLPDAFITHWRPLPEPPKEP